MVEIVQQNSTDKDDLYSFADLGQWVNLLTTRAENRRDFAKKDRDLVDAQNYLNLMQQRFQKIKEITLDKFADIILFELSKVTHLKLMPTGEPGTVLCASWRIPNDPPITEFAEVYRLYVRPNLISLKKGLENESNIYELKGVSQKDGFLGRKIVIARLNNISARLTTIYDCDPITQKNDGLLMSIEVGVN